MKRIVFIASCCILSVFSVHAQEEICCPEGSKYVNAAIDSVKFNQSGVTLYVSWKTSQNFEVILLVRYSPDADGNGTADNILGNTINLKIGEMEEGSLPIPLRGLSPENNYVFRLFVKDGDDQMCYYPENGKFSYLAEAN